MPFQNVEERVDRLEAVLMAFISESRQFQAEMRQSQAEMRQFQADMRQDMAEMRAWRIQAQKQWGEVTQKMGTFVEDIVAPNIPDIGRRVFGFGGQNDELISAPRVRIWHPNDPARMREIDYLYATRRGWIVVESRNSPKLNDVDQFRELLAEVREYFPQYAALPLRPIFASLYVPDHVVKYCTRHGIHALGMGPETMQLLNLNELPPTAPNN